MLKFDILKHMKSLSLSKPHIIVMVGVPGAGKSFFAEHFSETFSAPLVSWNNIRAELFNEPTYSKDEDEIVERVALHMLAQLVKTGVTVLYESNAQSQSHRQELVRTAKAAGYESIFVWVQIDATSAKSRALKNGLTAVQYERYARQFTPLKQTDTHIVISGKHTYASQLKIVLVRLSAPRTTQDPIRPRSTGGRSIIIR